MCMFAGVFSLIAHILGCEVVEFDIGERLAGKIEAQHTTHWLWTVSGSLVPVCETGGRRRGPFCVLL